MLVHSKHFIFYHQINHNSSFSFFSKIFSKFSEIRRFTSEFYLICKEGSKETIKDLKFINANKLKSENSLDFLEMRRLRIAYNDIYKLIPFAFFLLIPFSSLLLAPYLLFFPNGIPTRYTLYFIELRRNAFLKKRKQKSIEHLDKFFANKNKDIFKNIESLDFLDKCDSENLTEFMNFLQMEYFSLTFVLNQITRFLIKTPFFIFNILFSLIRLEKRFDLKEGIFDYTIKLNFFPFEIVKRKVLLYQLKKHLKKLMKEDKKLLETDENYLKQSNKRILADYMKERGWDINEDQLKNLDMEVICWRMNLRNDANEDGYLYIYYKNSKTANKLPF